jgi:chemotaxis protein CheZ
VTVVSSAASLAAIPGPAGALPAAPPGPAAPQQGLARIAGHVAAISGEVDRLLELPFGGAGEGETLAQALAEMRAMSKLLSDTRAEIVGLSPPPTGLGDTLDAVVAETEHAAMEIMQQAERAQAAAKRLHNGGSANTAADLAEVDDAATCILMACAFQDITGQRIRKVLSAMRHVETRIATLVALMGIGQEEALRPDGAPPGSEAALLNGPSSSAEGGLGQNAVDDLFN